jgi:ribonuclease P protein component
VVRPDDDRAGVALAFSLPRRVGGAVTRNRLRRQLREVVRGLEREREVAPGDYLLLVGPGAAGASFESLRGWVVELLDAAGRSR